MPPRKRAKAPPIKPAPSAPLEPLYVLRMHFLDPPATSNDVRSGGGHWAKQRAAHKDVAKDVCTSAKFRRIPRITRCRIVVVWQRADDARVDNDSLGPFIKACKDGLVQAGVLPDDRCQVVLSDVMEVHPNCQREGLYLIIEPLSAEWRSAAALAIRALG